MNYEIVHLDEKTVAGLRIRTSNSDPNMTRVIGELWQGFFANVKVDLPLRRTWPTWPWADMCVGYHSQLASSSAT